MSTDLEQLALLAEIDDLTGRLKRWLKDAPDWDTARRSRHLVERVLGRTDSLRIRLESPLVVATFGGTGTGKSSLVNALVGQDVTTTGRQRPTTTTPILLVHPDFELEALGLPLDRFQVKVVDAPVLKDIIVIDCPDPDTSDGSSAGSNLAILRNILPHCDVLLYTSTQQKYKNARVVDELGDAASGCRLVFVQTHADLDTDIREDWRAFLKTHYDVPEMFFVDSRAAFEQQQNNQRPVGEFGRLLDLLSSELGEARRVAIRRANLIDLLHEALHSCQANYTAAMPKVDELAATLNQQRTQIRDTLTTQLCGELMQNRTLWEQRLVSSVTDKWGFSPFSLVLKTYNGLGGLLASFTFFRARNSAQMALIGAVQGTRWLKAKSKEHEADSALDRLSTFGISDQQLQESRLLISGHVRSAGIDYDSSADRSDLSALRSQAASLEGEFLGDARRVIDDAIEKLGVKNSGWLTRVRYDALFMTYVVFLLGRIGYNFFWSSFLSSIVGTAAKPQPLLTVDFYIPALLFLVIWGLVLVSMFTWKLRRGLARRIKAFAERMAESRLAHGLFPKLDESCEHIERDARELSALLDRTASFRRKLADPSADFLGSRRSDS